MLPDSLAADPVLHPLLAQALAGPDTLGINLSGSRGCDQGSDGWGGDVEYAKGLTFD